MWLGFDWWVWLIALVVVVAGGWIKLKVFSSIKRSISKRPPSEQDD